MTDRTTQWTAVSPFRMDVLAKIKSSGATKDSPMRLRGAEFNAAIWLYENDRIGKVGSMFYPLTVAEMQS
jgi:hypothetical protein